MRARDSVMIVAALMANAAPSLAELIDVEFRGRVVSNEVTFGRYSGVSVGTPVRFRVRVDTGDVLSYEPQNFTTWYHVDYRLSEFAVEGRATALGKAEPVFTSSVVGFSGGNVYYQVDVPAVYQDLPEATILHCQFDGLHQNPFNNTGIIEQNLGAYSASVFDRVRYFNVNVVVLQPAIVSQVMTLEAETITIAAACYANCDGSTAAPALNVGDFTCFLQRFAAGDAYANCDGSTAPPALNVGDFTCFLQRYAAGCP